VIPNYLISVAAWPAPIVVPVNQFGNFSLTDSCVVDGTNNVVGSGNVTIDQDPFIEADLDNDGVIELYIDPNSLCHDLGGSLDPSLWQTSTTDVSQCTDIDPSDAGRHYTPLDDRGTTARLARCRGSGH
jgi:hypothetical protein